MKTNMGKADRIIRTIIGLVLIYFAFTAGWSILVTLVVGIIGMVLLGTAAMGHCPPYSILGINTCKLNKDV
jgi:hypothetical protein